MKWWRIPIWYAAIDRDNDGRSISEDTAHMLYPALPASAARTESYLFAIQMIGMTTIGIDEIRPATARSPRVEILTPASAEKGPTAIRAPGHVTVLRLLKSHT
jgi:hypothetical protein